MDMRGIVGHVGIYGTVNPLLNTLKRPEFLGCDSAGFAALEAATAGCAGERSSGRAIPPDQEHDPGVA